MSILGRNLMEAQVGAVSDEPPPSKRVADVQTPWPWRAWSGVARRAALAGVLALTMLGGVEAIPANAVQNCDTARGADMGRAELGPRRATGWNQPGECIKSVQRWVANAGGSFVGGG